MPISQSTVSSLHPCLFRIFELSSKFTTYLALSFTSSKVRSLPQSPLKSDNEFIKNFHPTKGSTSIKCGCRWQVSGCWVLAELSLGRWDRPTNDGGDKEDKASEPFWKTRQLFGMGNWRRGKSGEVCRHAATNLNSCTQHKSPKDWNDKYETMSYVCMKIRNWGKLQVGGRVGENVDLSLCRRRTLKKYYRCRRLFCRVAGGKDESRLPLAFQLFTLFVEI